MKKISILILILILTLTVSVFMTGCGGSSDTEEPADTSEPAETDDPEDSAPATFEEYVQANESFLKSFQSSEDEKGVKVTAEGNSLIYSFDFSKMEGYEKESVTGDDSKEYLESGLEDGASTFVNIADVVEKQTGISGIEVIVKYVWEDEVIYERTFTSEG